MDIHRIITKLQDVDKLKIILFDEKQRFIFDNLPKPGIRGEAKENINFMTMNKITMTKTKKMGKESTENYSFLLNGDPINSRMFDLMDRSLKREMKAGD